MEVVITEPAEKSLKEIYCRFEEDIAIKIDRIWSTPLRPPQGGSRHDLISPNNLLLYHFMKFSD
ncbi:hypothetical protein MATR_09480 [Marivirga tractuosa]|uniref:Hydroxyacylglutathione hydrolase (GloB) n=1 Tax=Marivirga tractuosa (strain ATCC 23168 / DSM 4126 / NBRC 15989 / NCIMB 1408 / VKM B-1430 / H-43) TaxID=643867 RepID=E4TMZ2_MARTH|nr:putative hydroxyacylglutathione hydrolase (GloB) [Marivirga tractuosa DSM 4126]BDD14123.1 hypothetical protein MATR_09480 [Marivirga tractuosa]